MALEFDAADGVRYRETHALLDDIAEGTIDGARKPFMENLATIPLLNFDDFGMRKLPPTAAEELLEIVMRRNERTSTLLTSNRPVDDWESHWVTASPSPRCWTDCSITVTSSNADHGTGGPKRVCPTRSKRGKTATVSGHPIGRV